MDMTRLQLVAPESVLVAAKDVTAGVEEALKAAKSVNASWMRTAAMDDKASAQSVAAGAALTEANLELVRFVEVVKLSERSPRSSRLSARCARSSCGSMTSASAVRAAATAIEQGAGKGALIRQRHQGLAPTQKT